MQYENITEDEQVAQALGDNEIPAVVVVVVAKDPGSYFEDMLFSVGEQDYENISVLVIDAGSTDPIADRVAKVLPEAYLHRIAGDPGWSVAANQSMELVSGSPFLLFCHDDIVLEKSCISTLMSELYKSNAGIVGPKLVSWDDPRKLLQIGMSSDRFGVPVDLIDRGEFDQEQYDSPRDVFFVPGAVQLIRSDLLAAVGGFDEAISFIGEDLDLCWRAHAVGARVRVVPRAKAKHIESVGHRISSGFKRKLATRHRLRTVLSTVGSKSRFTTVPIAVLLIIMETLYALFNGRRRHAREVFGALTWNMSRMRSARRRRKQLDGFRKLTDKEIRKKQVSGSAKISDFWRQKFEMGQSRLDSVLSNPTSAADPSSSFHSVMIFIVTLVILLFASRGIIFGGYKVFGQIPAITNTQGILREWFGGWRSAGTGGPGNPPLAYLILGSIRILFFWSPGLFQKLLIIVPMFVGFWGGTRIARPFGSARLRSIAGAAYVLNPIVFYIIRAGRWDSLVIWAAAPFLISSLMKIGDIEPFAQKADSEDSFFVPRTFPVKVLRYGMLVAFVATFAPSVIVVAVIIALALAFVSTINLEAFRGFIFSAIAAILVPAVLHIPWSYDIARSFSWNWLVGSKSSESSQLSILDIVLFRTADSEGLAATEFDFTLQVLTVAGLVLPVFALIATITAKSRSTRIIFVGWALSIVMWILIWLENVELLPIKLPAAESLLAPTLIGLILIVVSVSVDFEQAYLKSVSRLKHLTTTAGVIGLLVVFVGGATISLSGRWGMPDLPRRTAVTNLYANADSLADDEIPVKGRILWVGDPSVVPVDTLESELGVNYAITDEFVDIRNKWVSGPVGSSAGVGKQIDLASSGSTASLGKLLAPYGIEFVVVAEQLARDYQVNEIDVDVKSGLSSQLDLEIDQAGSSNFVVYKNNASGGLASAFPNFIDSEATTVLEQLNVNLSREPIPVETLPANPGRWRLTVPEEKAVFVSVPYKNMDISGVRDSIEKGFDDLSVLSAGEAGLLELRYPASYTRRLALLLQFLIISSGVIVAQTRKGGEA